MIRIERHEIDREAAASQQEARDGQIANAFDALAKKPDLLNFTAGLAKQYAGYVSANAPDSPDLAAALRSRGSLLAVILGRGSAIPLRDLKGKERSTPPSGRSGGADVEHWCQAFYIAAVCRDRALMDLLASISVDELRRASATANEYSYLFVEALQRFWTEAPDAPAKLLEALEATDPDGLARGTREFTLDIMVPLIDLAYRLMGRDEDAFNEALVKALEVHRDYWSRRDRGRDPEGFLALGPLAFACLAIEGGLSVRVESDYIPRTLIDWLYR